ncbi:MAG: hypothetical protein ACEY3F_04800 [Wolbachia sp.]
MRKKIDEEENKMGQYGCDYRNNKEHVLMSYLEEKQIFAMNSFFGKRPQGK